MIRLALILIAATGVLFAQAPPDMVPIQVLVNWPQPQIVAAKYGPLPKWAQFGEVIGCNRGTSNVVFGEGDVIAALRLTAGYQAFSRQDAMMLVSNSQSASKKNIFVGWVNAAASSVVDAKAAGLIGGGSGTGVGIVVGAELLKIIIPNANGVLTLRQVIQYNIDGLQTMMSIPAGRCTQPWSVLFGIPALPPARAATQAFELSVPKDR